LDFNGGCPAGEREAATGVGSNASDFSRISVPVGAGDPQHGAVQPLVVRARAGSGASPGAAHGEVRGGGEAARGGRQRLPLEAPLVAHRRGVRDGAPERHCGSGNDRHVFWGNREEELVFRPGNATWEIEKQNWVSI